ncbi:hypothetical protein ACFW9U_28335 [Rhodococcus aetherivorans]|uniref:hypothetical protein n=1 Tax=Rhodococcus aetherivorans TaxID=191292 RepID=UPI00366C8626
MKLVLAHGRSQGTKSEQLLREEWIPALRRGLKLAGKPPLPDDFDIRMPFYGAELDRLVGTPPPGTVVERGAADGKPNSVQAELLVGLAHRAGISDEAIAREMDVQYVEKGLQNWEWVQAVGRLLARRLPWLSEQILAQFLHDVDAYLTRVDVTTAVNGVVASEIKGDSAVVVGHSLGSIVTYTVLTELGDNADVPLFVTLGSPLGIPVVKRYLPRPLGTPHGVEKWFNGADERDPVALYARLDRDTFPADIENASDIHNPDDNPHGIVGYLSDTTVATRIRDALG